MSSEERFNAHEYWRQRLACAEGLRGTGSYGAPLSWQKWLYRGKERAYQRLLRRCGVRIAGTHVLDFGCGTGYFEDFWQSLGAHRVDGIDIVPEVVERLQREHPNRVYRCMDMSAGVSGTQDFGRPDLVTAIDVFYHIVDDDLLVSTLRNLVGLLSEQGCFLFTDALKYTASAPHVRFRPLSFWMDILADLGMVITSLEPVFVVNNRVCRCVWWMPGATGVLQYIADAVLLRVLPQKANIWAILARRSVNCLSPAP
jgi:SAM-dependent methyltransferase